MSSDINVQTFSGKVNITSNLLVGSSHLFVDTINNRVGLVTNTPSAGLHVNSNAYVHTDFRVGSGIVMNDTTGRITAGSFVGDGSGITSVNSDSGSWVNGTDVVYLSTIGDKVGIGTTSPSHALNVKAASGDAEVHIQAQGNDGGDAILYFNGSSTNQRKCAILSSNIAPNAYCKQDLHFCMETTDDLSDVDITDSKMILTNAGNVGIGTTSPGSALDVVGDVQISGSLTVPTISAVGFFNKKTYTFNPTGNTSKYFVGVSYSEGMEIEISDSGHSHGSNQRFYITRQWGGVPALSIADVSTNKIYNFYYTEKNERLYVWFNETYTSQDNNVVYTVRVKTIASTLGPEPNAGEVYTSHVIGVNNAAAFPAPTIYKRNGNVGIGGVASAANRLKVHGTVEATSFSGIQESDVPALSAYATTTALSDGLATKQASGSYAPIASPTFTGTVTATSFSGIQASNVPTLNQNTTGSAATATTATTATNADTVDGQHAHEMSWGHDTGHGTYTNFNSFINTDKFGAHYVTGSTNSPGHSGASQYYHQRMSLGSQYNNYSLQFAIPRNRTDSYLYYRNEEGGSASSWYKMRAGYADSAGTATNQSGGSVSATSGVFSGNLTATEVYCQNWIRTKGNSGHYWESTSNGFGWHIYPLNRSDMYIRTGSGNGGLAFTIGDDFVRGFIHCTTSNEIGFLNTGRAWSLRMDNSNNCQVYGRMYASGSVNTTMTARYYNSSGNNGAVNTSRPISVYAEQHMRCSELQVTSDRRIKTDIVDVDDGSALELLRKIQPKTYGYVDTMEKGTTRVYGFIAQEIKELIPEAIDVSEGDLPNIYGHATVDHEHNTITFRDFDTSNLNQTDSIIYIDQDDKRQTLKIKSVLNSTQLEIEEDLEKIVETFKTSELEEYNFTGEIFIWGQHVDDFHHLQKSAIFTVATAALQEVDRQLQAEKVKTRELQQKVEILEMSHGGLIQRIEALEKL